MQACPAALFAQTTDESFRPPFSKGGTDPTPWGVGRPPQRTKYPYRSKAPERGSKSSDLRGGGNVAGRRQRAAPNSRRAVPAPKARGDAVKNSNGYLDG